MHALTCLVLAAQLGTVLALRLPFRRDFDAEAALSANAFVKRASGDDPYDFSVVDFTGDNQIIYTANVTVDGQSYEVSFPIFTSAESKLNCLLRFSWIQAVRTFG